MGKKAILIGASGSIGSSLLFQLLECTAYSNVLVLARQPLEDKKGIFTYQSDQIQN